MLGCTTTPRPPDACGPEAIARLAADAGLESLALTTGCTLDRIPALVRAGAGAGVPVSAVAAPMARSTLPAEKRVPHLAAIDDRDERLAALVLVDESLSAARDAGAERVLLDLGPAPLTIRQAAFEDAFVRRALDEGDPGHRVFRDALAERRSVAPRLLDAARFSIERAVRAAERAGIALTIGFAATPWGLPSPKEALELMRELSGAPVGLAFDTGRWEVARRLGLDGPPGRRDDLLAVAGIVIASDAVGLVDDLAPGLGERDDAAALPEKLPTYVTGRRDTTPVELTNAAEVIRRAISRPRATSGA